MHLYKNRLGKVIMVALAGVLAGSLLAPTAGTTSLSYVGENSLAGISLELDAYAENSGVDDVNI